MASDVDGYRGRDTVVNTQSRIWEYGTGTGRNRQKSAEIGRNRQKSVESALLARMSSMHAFTSTVLPWWAVTLLLIVAST